MKKAQYTPRSLSVEVLAEAEVVGGVKLAPEPAWVEGTSLRLPELPEVFPVVGTTPLVDCKGAIISEGWDIIAAGGRTRNHREDQQNRTKVRTQLHS